MSREYAEQRIREALSLCKGNPTKARQKIMAWCYEDPRLLQALSRPHLTGIVAHAVNRVVHKQELEPDPVPDVPESLDMGPASFGKEILQALGNNTTPQFGAENEAPRPRRKKASQSHIDALRKISSKNKNSRD